MQPLALPKNSTTADATDSGNQTSAPSKGGQASDFTDMLFAALPAAGSIGAPAVTKTEQSGAVPTDAADIKNASAGAKKLTEADPDVAGLIAASQIAALGVTPPPAPTPKKDDDLQLTIMRMANPDKALNTSSGADIQNPDGPSDANPKSDAASHQAANTSLPDSAGLNIQALMGLAASVTTNQGHSAQGPTQLKKTVEPAAKAPLVQADETKPTTKPAAAASQAATTPVVSLTNGLPTVTAQRPQLTDAGAHTVDKSSQPAASAQQPTDSQVLLVTPPSSAQATSDPTTLQAERQATVATAAATKPAVSLETTVPAQALPPVPKKSYSNEPIDHAADKDQLGTCQDHRDHDAASGSINANNAVQQPQNAPAPASTNDVVQTAPATVQTVMTPQDASTTTDAQQSSPDFVLRQAEALAPKQSTGKARSAVASALPDVALQRPDASRENFVAQLQRSSTQHAPSEQPSGVQTTTAQATAPDRLVESDHAKVTNPSSAGINQPTSSTTPAVAEVVAASVDPLPAAPIVNSTSPQAVEVRQSEIAQLKIREDAKSNEQTLQATKADVGIRELMKLGATEIKVTSEPQSVSMKTYQEAPLSAPVQDPTTTAPTAQQAAPLATASADTNGQRRTIADDIRLRAMERMVVNAARNGTQTLSIQLYPPGLGQVVLRLAMDGQRLRLATRAATTDAADTLRNMENDLREALAGNGLHLAGFDVSEDGTQEDTQRRQQPEQIAKTTNSDTSETFTVDLNA